MGCDIHLHTEVKIDGQWHHYSAPNCPRHYALFALMCGVRGGSDVKPVAPIRGLPEDMSLITKLSAERWDGDGHSHTWMNAAELSELDKRWQVFVKENNFDLWEYDLENEYFGYLEFGSWAGFADYPNERPKCIEDVRFVFWFDN